MASKRRSTSDAGTSNGLRSTSCSSSASRTCSSASRSAPRSSSRARSCSRSSASDPHSPWSLANSSSSAGSSLRADRLHLDVEAHGLARDAPRLWCCSGYGTRAMCCALADASRRRAARSNAGGNAPAADLDEHGSRAAARQRAPVDDARRSRASTTSPCLDDRRDRRPARSCASDSRSRSSSASTSSSLTARRGRSTSRPS